MGFSIKLSDHFDYGRLLRFTLPSILMMIFTSIYDIIDGLFVANFVGKVPFAAVNLIIPFLMILGTVGFVFGTGGSAIVAKTLGEGDRIKANRYFSLFIYVALILGIIIAAFGITFIREVSMLLGADGEMLDDCVTYGRIVLFATPAFVLQWSFQSFFVAAEKPQLGFLVSVITGITNIVLDALFIVLFGWGLEGAAFATVISECAAGVIPLIYFGRKNASLLRLTRTAIYIPAIVKACVNGSSEFMGTIAMSLVSMIYNLQLLKYVGVGGVAAYGVLMYVGFIFASIFIGYSMGVAPIISYHFGAKDYSELRNLLQRSLKIIACFAGIMFVIAEIFAEPIANIFFGDDSELAALTCHAFGICAFSYLLMGFAIFASDFFTALNDGVTSAIISFLRTLVFEIAAVMLLPLLFGVDGIWLSMVVAELMAVVLSATFFVVKQKKYHYGEVL